MKKIKLKIWFLLGVLTSVVLGVDLSISYEKLTTELRDEAENNARTVYGLMMASRRIYQQQFVKSGLPVNEETIGFLPAHSFSRIAKDFSNWNDSGIIFNNVSDRPRNPGNQADRFELDAIAWLRANPTATERTTQIVDDKNVGYLLYTAPIWVEPFCLKCHGKREDAPPSIRENFDNSYDYAVNDLRGVVSVKIPVAKFNARRLALWQSELIKSLVSYGILFLALGFLLDWLVTRRLTRLRMGAEKMAAGDYSVRMDPDNEDELCQLARSFNAMAETVQERDQSLGKLFEAINQSPASVIITDLEGKIEYVNNFFVTNTGYSREEALGNNPSFLKSEQTPQQTHLALWQALNRGEVWRGEFVNKRKNGTLFNDTATISPVRNSEGRVTHYVSVQQDISERKQAEAKINQLAYYDPLTDLPNRRLLEDRLALSLALAHRQANINALILVNIDHFKKINDARGQSTGDALLIAVGLRLQKQLREGDTLSRMGGDEFAILLQGRDVQRETASNNSLTVAERIHADLSQPFMIGSEDEIKLSVSLGITLFPDSHNDCSEEVMRRANTALHRAQSAGRAQTAFFETAMGESAEQHFRIERELRHAIMDGQLRLFLQPQVDHLKRLVGTEALVRWQHPQRGLLPPGVFIGIAEESGLIVELGAWMLNEACRLIALEAVAGRLLRISVNISPRQFRESNFVHLVKDALAASGADPRLLTLEVTEGLVIDNVGEVVAKMLELTNIGIHFSIDDFGTGYSSLAYLKRLPIDELKIDKTFIQDAPTDPNDAALVESILSVAYHMHLKVVAEGVETIEQEDFLDKLAPNIIRQGYLYGKPEPAEIWLRRWEKMPD